MGCYITITNADNTAVWQKLGSYQNYTEIKDLLRTGRGTCNVAEALLMPVRTNTLSNFAKDLFLPTTLHYAARIENVALRVLATIPAFILDVATLAIRLITCIPRAIYNSQQEEHPLRRHLAEQGADSKILDSDCVRVRGIYIDGSVDATGREFSGSETHFIRAVNLIEARYYEFSGEDDSSGGSMSGFLTSTLRSQVEKMGLTASDEVMAHLGPRAIVESPPMDREIEELA